MDISFLMGKDGDHNGVIALSPVELGLCSCLLVINAALSLRLNLGLHYSLMIAAVRMVVQLTALGYILSPLFEYNRWWMVCGYSVFMVLVASNEAVQRTHYTYQGMLLNTVLSMASVSSAMLLYVVFAVLRLSPWFDAQYFIPIMGMVLGNATSSIAVGLSASLDELAASRDSLEQLLSLGASRYEAALPTIRRSIGKAATPIINQMSVLGLVSIPGMMTGQILSGSDPSQAARYQMMIMFLIGSTSALSSALSVYLAVFHVIDQHHCYRPDRLIKTEKAAGGGALVGGAKKVGRALQRAVHVVFCCSLGRPSPPSTPDKSQHIAEEGLSEPLLPPSTNSVEPSVDGAAAADGTSPRAAAAAASTAVGAATEEEVAGDASAPAAGTAAAAATEEEGAGTPGDGGQIDVVVHDGSSDLAPSASGGGGSSSNNVDKMDTAKPGAALKQKKKRGGK